jgi:hypothetical protein
MDADRTNTVHTDTSHTDACRTPPPASEMGSAELQAEILALVHRLASGTYELLVLIGELDERGTWALSGALSCAAWLANVCDIDAGTARHQLRVARALREFPQLDSALARGDLSYAKARVLAAHLDQDNADELIGLAERTPAGHLGAAVAAWSNRHDDPAVIRSRHQEQRGCSWRCDPDGMITLTARMTPEAAAVVCAVIDTHVMRAPDAPAGASPRPSLAQQRHDALAHALAHDSQITTEIVIHVDEDANTLPDGTPLSDHTVSRLLPDAFVSLLLHDTRRHPIDASPRRRAPTTRQRRVLDARQPRCAHPGCTCETFLQYDHVTRFADGGPTTLDNLQRLCGPHNRAKEPDRR